MVCQPFCQPARWFVEEGKRWLCLRDRQRGNERDEADGEGAGKDANVYGSFKVSVKVGAPLSGVQL